MSGTRRPYRSSLREDQARATRRSVVEAARDLFLEVGWSRTTIDAVAQRAGVSRKTVFTAVGGKAVLIKLALDWALVGDDEPVPMADRPEVADLEAQTEPVELVRRWARFNVAIGMRAGPLADVLAVAADVDPEAAQVHATSERNRLSGAEAFVHQLHAIGGLRRGLTVQDAVPTALVLMDPSIPRTLVRGHGWNQEEYAAWVERIALAELVGQGSG